MNTLREALDDYLVLRRGLGFKMHSCCRSDYLPGMVSRYIVGADGRRRGLCHRVAQCGTVVESELSAQNRASWFFRGAVGWTSRRCKRNAGVKGHLASRLAV